MFEYIQASWPHFRRCYCMPVTYISSQMFEKKWLALMSTSRGRVFTKMDTIQSRYI
jgi:hypothetical protein